MWSIVFSILQRFYFEVILIFGWKVTFRNLPKETFDMFPSIGLGRQTDALSAWRVFCVFSPHFPRNATTFPQSLYLNGRPNLHPRLGGISRLPLCSLGARQGPLVWGSDRFQMLLAGWQRDGEPGASRLIGATTKLGVRFPLPTPFFHLLLLLSWFSPPHPDREADGVTLQVWLSASPPPSV